MNLDIRQLRYFLAVADERSFTRGAERLNMAQPPLSRRIQELEAEIGSSLFERDKRPLRLTETGRILHEQALMVIQAMDRLKSRIADVTVRPRTRFTLGLVPSVLYARFPEIVEHFRSVLPDVELSLAEMDSAEQVQALVDGRIDAGFDRIVIDDPHLRHAVMREESLVLAVPIGDPLLSGSDPTVSLSQIAGRPILLYPRHSRPSYADLVLKLFESHGIAPSRVTEVRELQSAMVMVAAKVGCCIVPESVRRMARPDIGFLSIAENVGVPLLLRARRHDRSRLLRTLLHTYADLCATWGWPVSRDLLAWKADLDEAHPV